MATRVLIINRQLVFAVTIKQALEQTGRFDVHLFTTAEAAFDFLRAHPQDLALLDYNLPGRSGAKVVQQLRAIQNDLALIVSPRQPENDVSHLNLQGMIDMPFGARDVIPLIERALDPNAAPPKQTRQFDEDPLPTAGQGSTKNLRPDEQMQKRQFGTTERLEPPKEPPENRPQTRILNEEPRDKRQTRILNEEPENKPPTTGTLGETAPYPTQTRKLDNEALENWHPNQTRKLDDQPPRPIKTRKLEDSTPMPAAPPEISDLDAVLKNFGFEPPVAEGDTPSVPTKDSDALRQFLATANSAGEGEVFDDVLGAIEESEYEEHVSRQRNSDFEGLVNSMRSEEQHQTLPTRQQQLMDFILTTGMDSVLSEIEKTKTGPLPIPTTLPEERQKPRNKPASSFDRLAQEEPPMPTLEESGTVSDLLLGINDTGFRDVLSLLRGEEVEEREPNQQRTIRAKPTPPETPQGPATGRQQIGEEQEDPAQIRSKPRPSKPKPKPKPAPPPVEFDFDADEPDDEATVAQVVLKTALDDLTLPDGFSVDRLITDIEDRLSEHKLNLRPLPSWNMDTTQFRAVVERAQVAEPSFLPEKFPPGEIIPPELPEMPPVLNEEQEPESYTGRTTRASEAEREHVQPYPEDADTMHDQAYLDDTAPSHPIKVEPPLSPEATIAHSVANIDWGSDDETPRGEAVDEWDYPVEEAENAPVDEWGYEAEAGYEADEAENEYGYVDDAYAVDAPYEVNEAENAQGYVDDAYAVNEAENPPVDEWGYEAEAHSDAVNAIQWDALAAPVEPDYLSAEDVVNEPEPTFIRDMLNEQVGEFNAAGIDDWSISPEEAEEPQEPEVVEPPLPPEDSEEARIAQLALNLTQVSLELSAEGTLLTRNGEVVAYAGHLSQEDTLELRRMVQDDWEADANGARVRFITLPSSGKEYMLYSIRSEDGLTLSMIFEGTTPLRTIRKQGQRLIEALQAVPPTTLPEIAVMDTVAPVALPDPGPFEAYAFVWMLREPDTFLTESVAQALTSGLTTQLRELRWKIQTLEIRDEYVYLLADVPGERSSNEIILDLKQRSAEIVRTQDAGTNLQLLWADSYLILAPGRPLDADEIMEYIHFQRMV